MSREFGKLLRALRKRAGKTMGELARHLEVTVPYVSDVERSHRPPLTPPRILKAAEFLGVEPERLLVAAAKNRGAVELNIRSSSAKAREVGVALSRSWPYLDEQQLEAILKIAAKKG